MTTLTWAIEMDLGAAIEACDGTPLMDCGGYPILAPNGWTDVTPDVRLSTPIPFRQGIRGSDVTDRVAAPGELSFQMDNSASNSAGLVGYYSPDHANCRLGFDVGTNVRLKLASGANTYYMRAHVKRVSPRFGLRNERTVDVTATDYMDQLSMHKLRLIPVQLSKRNDQLVQTILDNLDIQPLNTSLGVGADTFSTALNAETDEKTFAITALQKCMQSGMDYLYVRGNSTDGETLVYEPADTRLLNTTSKASLVDTMSGFEVIRSTDKVWNIVRATAYPDKYDVAAVVLWSSNSEISINAGQSTTVTARYRDPSGLSQRSSLYPGSEVTPVADTDYKMSSVSNNGGNNLNANLSILVEWGGNTAEVTLTNTSASTGYVNLFQLRGRGIYHYDPITTTRENEGSKYAYGDKELSFNLPYQGNVNTARDFATDILKRHFRPISDVSSVRFFANRSSALMTAALTCVIGDRVTINETVTGINSDFYINSVQYQVNPGGLLEVNWLLEPASVSQLWILDDLVLSILETTTYL